VIQAGATEKKRAALSRELQEFLIELSIAVHRFAMYPPGHPSLAPAVSNVISRLVEIFESRRTVSIGVAHQQLVIEGVATDPRHPVLSDLARRLHGHQLGAISFSTGTKGRDVEGVLQLLASESDREGVPVGLRPADQLPKWEFAQIYPVGYDRLELQAPSAEAEDTPSQLDRATQLWLGLAQSALAGDAPVEASSSPDPKDIARVIQEHRRESAYDQVIVGYMLQLADELKASEGGESEKVRRRLSTLVNELGDDTLSRLVEMGGNDAQRRKFLLDANQSLAVDAVVKVLRAAASASEQNISNSLTRLLSKLAVHAEMGSDRMRAQADTALRENVEELISDWKLADPNPDQYTAVLDAMARSNPLFGERVAREEALSGSARVVQMVIEVGGWGPTVEAAVADLLNTGQGARLIQLVDGAPADNAIAERMRSHLTHPTQLKRVLEGADVDEGTLMMLTERLGSAAITPLLDVLADSDSRSVRRKVFDQLVKMGPEVGERAVERLADGRWFVLRNMLALLQRLDELPAGFDPARLLEHPDERVRRESLPLALRRGTGRERIIASALGDKDERTVRMALLELQRELPETVVPVVVARVIRSGRSPEIRALGARALGSSRSALALEVLVGLSTGGKTLLGKPRLADKSPEVVAALQTLARSWGSDPRAQEVLGLALRAKDPELRGAAGGTA
jgi:hypothetical protein